jgi:hypothetical protein
MQKLIYLNYTLCEHVYILKYPLIIFLFVVLILNKLKNTKKYTNFLIFNKQIKNIKNKDIKLK